MSVPVLTAVTDAVWEADLVAALDRADLGITVVRRCVDLADLLATAASGTARAVLLSADLRRLDRDALTRLSAAGVAVVGLVEPGDEQAERRLRQLGVRHVLAADAGAPVISAAVVEAVAGAVGRRPGGYADPAAALPDLDRPGHSDPGDPAADARHAAADHGDDAGDAGGAPTGLLVAVWGPTGAPGRTTVAVGLADETARLGTPTLLVDADVYGGVVGQVLGLLDEAPGLAAAARLAGQGTLDAAALAGIARTVTPGLRVLTGISRADRWPELRAASVEAVLAQCRTLAGCTVVDCGFSLEQDEEVVYDTAAPRRNGATFAALEGADTVLAVGSADPVGLHRLIRGLDALRTLRPDVEPLVVVNRLRRHVIPGDPAREIRTALERYAGVSDPVLLPYDLAATDAALAAGRTLGEVAPKSPLRQGLAALAARLTGAAVRHGAVPTMTR